MNHHMPHPAAVDRAMSAAQQLLASLGDDGEDEVLRTDVLEAETDVIAVIKFLIRSALEAESMERAAKARVDDLINRADRFAARAHSARETVKQMLDALGVNRIQDPEFGVFLRVAPPKVLITDENLLEDEFVRIKKTPDRVAIGKALEAGRQVSGAALSNGGLVLSVRTR